jgi:hypothetical protein
MKVTKKYFYDTFLVFTMFSFVILIFPFEKKG